MDTPPDYIPASFWRLVKASDIARITGVNISTARRYKREKDAPRPVRVLLNLWLDGRILPKSWKNSRFDLHSDRLVVDEVQAYSLGEFRAQFWLNQALQLECQNLRARVNRTQRPRRLSTLAEPAKDLTDSARPRLRAAPAPTPGADSPSGQTASPRRPAPQLRRYLSR